MFNRYNFSCSTEAGNLSGAEVVPVIGAERVLYGGKTRKG
jgi:hypothetical protein